MTSIKRGHKTLSILDKIKILDELKKGVSGKALAQKYGVGKSTISDIKKKKQHIYTFAKHSDHQLLKKRKTLKKAEYDEFEQELYSWFENQRRKHVAISKEILCEKARLMFADNYGNDKQFLASNGWYQKFRARFSVRGIKICGEKLSSREDLVPEFRTTLANILHDEDLLNCQVYNADESALFWKMLPDRTLVHANEKNAPGRKLCKERVTFLCCANKSGTHKLNIVVVGKSQNPRAFNKNPPVEYYASKNGWMTTNIFSEWFHKSFIPQVKAFQVKNNLPLKALLIVDNAACHSKTLILSECSNFKVIFLPPNTTSLIQPMDQNPIRITKMFYKKSLLLEVVNSYDKTPTELLKEFNIKQACILLKHAWAKVSEIILRSSWSKLFPEDWAPEDDLPLATLQQRQESDDDSSTIGFLTQTINSSFNINIVSEEVQDWIIEENSQFSSDVSENDDLEENTNLLTAQPVKARDASQSLETCIKWAEENNVDMEKVLILYELRDLALEKCILNSRQTTIGNYFKKKD